MKKIILNLSIVFTVLLIVSITTILMADYKSAYKQIAGTLKVDASLIKTEDVKIVKFPFPYVEIKQIKQDGKIELIDTKIEFSTWSVLTLSPKISSINVREAQVRLNSDDTNLIYHDHFIAELIQKDLLSIKTYIGKLTLIESDNDIALVLNNFILKKSGSKYNFSGKSDKDRKLEGNFQKNNDEIIFNLETINDNYELTLQETYKDNKLVSGNASFKNLNTLGHIFNLIPNFIASGSNFNKLEKINADFVFTSDESSWNISTLKLNSEWLDGSGNLKITRTNGESEVNMEFEKIDLSNIASGADDQVPFTTNKFAALKFNSKISCLVKNLSFKTDQFKNIALKLNIADSKAQIENLTGDFDDLHKFQITGELTTNSFLSSFDGSIAMSHPNIAKFAGMFGDQTFDQPVALPFTFRSGMRITPVYFSFQNMDLKLEEMNITGDYSSKFIGQIPRINANLKINNLDLTKKSSINSINEVQVWLENSLSGMKLDDYQNKFIPIRKINSIGSYDINIENLKYQDHQYNNISFNLETEGGSVAVNRLFINAGNTWFDMNLSLTTKSVNPILIVKVNDGVIDTESFSAQGLLDLRAKILENLDLSKINCVFSGYLTALKKGDSKLDRIIFSFNNNKNLLTFTDLNFDLFSGRMTMSGSVLLEPLTLNFSYALNAANLSKISDTLPKNLLILDGLASANGVLSTNGDSLEKLLFNLYSKSSVIAKGVVINNFSIDQFIGKINNENYDVNNLSYDVDKMLLTDSTTITDFKSDLLLSKGVIELSPITFKTASTSNAGDLKLNIYDYTLDSDLITNFYILQKRKFKPSSYQPIAIKLKTTGDLMNISRKITTEKILEVINVRNTEEGVVDNMNNNAS